MKIVLGFAESLELLYLISMSNSGEIHEGATFWKSWGKGNLEKSLRTIAEARKIKIDDLNVSPFILYELNWECDLKQTLSYHFPPQKTVAK